MQLTVVLGVEGHESFNILLNDNAFVKKWVNELQWHLTNCDFNQDEAFASMTSLRDASEILTNACVTINRYLKGFIEVRDGMQSQSQEYFNYLHSKFEKISGKFGKPTRLFEIAPLELKAAIRDLNFYIHRVESQKPATPELYVSFDKNQYRRQPLTDADYEFCEFAYPAGTLHTHYVELGKEFTDLYKDNLPVDYAGFSNLHYYGAEAMLIFSDYDAFSDIDYVNWLVRQGFNPYNKKLGHGRIPLGRVNNLSAAKEMISRHQYIHSIVINS